VDKLYLASLDTNRDRQVDTLYVAVRGSMFGEPDVDSNAMFGG